MSKQIGVESPTTGRRNNISTDGGGREVPAMAEGTTMPKARNAPSGAGTCAPEQVLQSVDEFLIRPLGQSGFELVIGLPALPDLEKIRLLVGRKDRHLLIERAAALESPAESNGHLPITSSMVLAGVKQMRKGLAEADESVADASVVLEILDKALSRRLGARGSLLTEGQKQKILAGTLRYL